MQNNLVKTEIVLVSSKTATKSFNPLVLIFNSVDMYSVDFIKHTVFLIEIFWKIENSMLARDSTQNLSAKRYSNVRTVH